MGDGNPKLEKAVKLLNKRGLGGLIIYSCGISSMLYPSYLQYFAELKPLGSSNAVILSRSSDILLLVEPPWDLIRASQKSWITDVRSSSDFLKDLTYIMHEFGIAGSVGVVGSKEMTQTIYGGFNKEANIELVDEIIEEIAREKTEKEMHIVKKTANIADIGFEAFLKYARVGIREYELTAAIEFAMGSAGADDFFNLISSGEHNYAMHASTDRRLREGDVVIVEITPVCEGQFIQLCRTVVMGKASRILIEKYSMLVGSLEESLKQIKPGAPASTISIAMNRVISEAGYGKYCYPPYMRARGHGLGVGSMAPAVIIDDSTKTKLEKGQVVVVHPNQYLPETGYLACGETVLVTASGMERLSGTDVKLYIKEG